MRIVRKGSVIVDFSLGVDDVTNNDLLKKIFSRNPLIIGNKTVDPNSFVFSGKPRVAICH